MTSSNNLTFLTSDVKGLQSSKKRIKLIEYFKSKLNHIDLLFFYKKHTQLLRMKIHGSMILMGWFSFHMEHTTPAMF